MLHCWRFLLDHPMDSLQRLVMMIRGIADPLVSAYCRLYLVRCAQRLPQRDTGANSRSLFSYARNDNVLSISSNLETVVTQVRSTLI